MGIEDVRHALLDFYVTEADGSAISALSPKYKSVIELLVSGGSYSAIAEDLRLSRNGVALIAQRCVQLLTAAREERERDVNLSMRL